MKSFWNRKKDPQKKSSSVGNMMAWNVPGKAVWTPKNYEELTKEGYQKNVIVFRCVSLISRSAASVPWRLHHNDQELQDHPLLTLLHHPNPVESGAAFIESVLGFKLLSGNSYIEMVRNARGLPEELYVLRPDRMQTIPGPSGLPEGYVYKVHGQDRMIPADPLTGTSNILHLKAFHPLNDWYGMSPIEAAACAIDQHNAVSSHNLALLQNGGRPSGALKMNASQNDSMPLTDEYRDMLRNELRQMYSGENNAGRVLLLEGDIQWQEMGLSPKDLDFVSGKHMSMREIAQAFGVPALLIGVPGDSTFANYREARLHLWEDTILPLLDHLCDAFNSWLVPQYGSGLKLTYDIDGIPALSDRREKTWSRIQNADFLTLNEKRYALGYPPVEGGDHFPNRGNK